MSENHGVSALTGKRVKGDNNSAIKQHNLICNHSSNFDEFSILASNNNNFKVTLMENFLINRDHYSSLNKNKHLLPLEVNNIVNFENISYLFLMFLMVLLLTLNK